ncbi:MULTISPECIES: zinc-dependent alcohol dehydrogenase [Paenibacillus]|uniref:zinc-dependent alcohol dehydrogenase n=1 Tax=Paenibacillus TaxID=44249 RepID=UPI0011A16354|nr:MULTISPECIES: zinc-binding alcohol dehydrogenase [Paenibacillus]MBJ9992351.1 zinc-binding alcohol dehydrogenase [Paenibacillus sp. S28]
MENKKIIFTAPWQVEVETDVIEDVHIGKHEVLVQKKYSLISPGTELACLSGNEGWFQMPGVPGYSSVSEIIELGEEVQGFKQGDYVFHYGDHSLYSVVSASGIFLKAPSDLPLHWVPFTRMASVAMTSLRVSDIELGDHTAVTGLGLIGNMAAQLATLQGASVIGIDLSNNRLVTAQASGIENTLQSGPAVQEQIREITRGKGVTTLIDATGIPQVVREGLPWVAKYGEVILLGSPRGEYRDNITDLLNYIHLDGHGCITFKGAHEWRYPVEPDAFVKHSLTRNSHIIFDLMKRNKLKIDPLISHIVKPEQAAQAYEGLRNDKDHYHGVLFDWS